MCTGLRYLENELPMHLAGYRMQEKRAKTSRREVLQGKHQLESLSWTGLKLDKFLSLYDPYITWHNWMKLNWLLSCFVKSAGMMRE